MLQKHTNSVEISVSQQDSESEQSRQNNIPSDNLLERYWKRQVVLEQVSFIDICEKYEYAKQKASGVSNTVMSFVYVSYLHLSSAKVLVICGKEIPDIKSHPDPEIVEFYYTSLLTLFKPRRQTTLLDANQSALAGYRTFIHHADSSAVRCMKQF